MEQPKSWTREIGKYISRKIEKAEWGEGVVARLAQHLARRFPGRRGSTRANLFRTRQFHETYAKDKRVAPLVRQLPWTHNLIILSQSRRAERTRTRRRTPHTARMADDQALGKVMQILLKDDTQVYKQFVENEAFRREVSDMVYPLTS